MAHQIIWVENEKPKPNGWAGKKYHDTKGLNLGQLRWLVEGDIFMAIRKGRLPQADYSVQSAEYEDKDYLRVFVSGVTGQSNIFSIHPEKNQDFTANEIVETIEDILWEYNGYQSNPFGKLDLRFTPQIILN